MRTYSIILSICVFVLMSCLQKEKSPVLSISKEIINLGEIMSDSVLKFYVEYQNSGIGSLKIINASADCGYTSIKFDKEILMAGEKGSIEIIYTPAENKDSGVFSKNIAIRTNATTPIKVITIKGIVIK